MHDTDFESSLLDAMSEYESRPKAASSRSQEDAAGMEFNASETISFLHKLHHGLRFIFCVSQDKDWIFEYRNDFKVTYTVMLYPELTKLLEGTANYELDYESCELKTLIPADVTGQLEPGKYMLEILISVGPGTPSKHGQRIDVVPMQIYNPEQAPAE